MAPGRPRFKIRLVLFESKSLTFTLISLTCKFVAKALGQGTSWLVIISAVLLAIMSFFYVYTVGSYLKVNIYIFQNRVTYDTIFDFHVISEFVDHLVIALMIIIWLALTLRGKAKFLIAGVFSGITLTSLLASSDPLLDVIALTSVPVAAFLIIYDRLAKGRKIILIYDLSNTMNLFINYLAIIGLVIGILGIIAYSEAFFYPGATNLMPTRDYAYQVFVLFSSVSPVLIFVLVSCIPMKLLVREFSTKILKVRYGAKRSTSTSERLVEQRTKIIYLSLFVLLSICIVIVPHQLGINQNGQDIGVDTHFYAKWVGALIQSTSTAEFIQQAFVVQSQGDRPIALVLIFSLVKLIPLHISSTIEYMPVFLAPAHVLVVYFLTRELLPRNDIASLLAALLTAVSYHALIGVYAGFYANWLALIIGFLSFVFLLRYLRVGKRQNLFVFSALLTLLSFTHVYTWSVLSVFAVAFLGICFAYNLYSRKGIILLLIAVLFTVIIDGGRSVFLGASGGIERDLEIAYNKIGLDQFSQRWGILVDVTQNIVGGQFSNFIILVLCLYWLIHCDMREASSVFILTFLSIGVIPLFFGDWSVKTRIFYDIPFQMPAAIALATLAKQRDGTIRVLPICVWLVAVSFRAMSNLYPID